MSDHERLSTKLTLSKKWVLETRRLTTTDFSYDIVIPRYFVNYSLKHIFALKRVIFRLVPAIAFSSQWLFRQKLHAYHAPQLRYSNGLLSCDCRLFNKLRRSLGGQRFDRLKQLQADTKKGLKALGMVNFALVSNSKLSVGISAISGKITFKAMKSIWKNN